MSNNNHINNGKEVYKDQLSGNEQKVNNPKPVNRIKKKNITEENKIHPAESKKIPIIVNKNPNRMNKNTPKGQVIKLEDKKSKIHQADSNTKKTNSPVSSATEAKAYSNDKQTFKTSSSNSKNKNEANKKSNLPDNLGKLLLLVAIVLFVTWVVIFFYYNTGGNVHMILALAVICGLVSLIGWKRN